MYDDDFYSIKCIDCEKDIKEKTDAFDIGGDVYCVDCMYKNFAFTVEPPEHEEERQKIYGLVRW